MSVFPIRCVVETTFDGQCVNCCTQGNGINGLTLVDSYTIVSGQTPLSQLIGTVLTALGLPHLLPGAKGMIQMKNWKALAFELITDEKDIEIESLLRDISSQTTLKIIVLSKRVDTNNRIKEMKDRLLKVALQKIPAVLSEIKEPHLKEFVTQLVKSDGCQLPPIVSNEPVVSLFNTWLDSWSRNGDEVKHLKRTTVFDGHQQTTTRFSQMLEVPKLERWFIENSNPSRHKLIQYMHLLNGSNFRKHTAKITYQQICNWFSNARASSRRRTGCYVRRKAPPGGKNKNTNSSSASTENEDAANDNLVIVALPEHENRNSESSTNSKMDTVSSLANEYNRDVPTTVDSNYASVIISCPPSTISKQMSVSSEILAARTNDATPLLCSSTSDDISVAKDHVDDEDNETNAVIEHFNGPSRQSIKNSSVSPLSTSANALKSIPGTVIRCPPSVVQPNNTAAANRTRLMFDPLTELPVLEKWFDENPHPSWIQIDQYTDALNGMLYRLTYPSVSSHNVKIWFKNRRAKCKRRALGGPNVSPEYQ